MSGITGICYLDNRVVDRLELEKMTTTLAHRGQDGAGVWCKNSIGLGHRLLWTTPESKWERFPLVHPDGQIVLTADARIDNRAELIAQLDMYDRPSGQITDSELILRAYEKWGTQCPTKLIGDFSFAIWDSHNQMLFCARDHIGVRPFYYYKSNRTFVFASEIKAILCLPGVPRRLNELKVAQYLTETFNDKISTFYQDILRLPPGHSLTVSQYGTRLTAYWSLNPEIELHLKSNDEYAEAYREVFTEAVRCRLRSAFPVVGSLLSGGLDSSSITCVARDLLTKQKEIQLHTFSSVFDDVPESNERPFIEAVIDEGGVVANFSHADQLSPLGDLDRMFWHQDEAIYAYNMFVIWKHCTQVRDQGGRVLLDGMLGDSTIPQGEVYLAQLAYTGRWLSLLRELQPLSRRYNYSIWKAMYGNVWHNFFKPRLPKYIRRYVYKHSRGKAAHDWQSILNQDFVRRLSKDFQIANQIEIPMQVPLARRAHFVELTSGILPFALELTNKLASAFGVESRFPFSDKRLVEFCLALPPEQKLGDGWPRWIVRQAITNLPEKVRWRTGKGNLAPNFRRGLLTFEQKLLDKVILSNSQVIEPFVDLTALRNKYQGFRKLGQQANKADVEQIWLAVTLALWLKRTNLGPLT